MTDLKKDLEIIWGAKDIGAAISVTERQAFHMLEKGEVPGARKWNGKWCVSRRKLREFFGLTELV